MTPTQDLIRCQKWLKKNPQPLQVEIFEVLSAQGKTLVYAVTRN